MGGVLPARVTGTSGWFYDGLLTESHPCDENEEDQTIFVTWATTCTCGCAQSETKKVIFNSVEIPDMWCASPPSPETCRLVFYLGYLNAMDRMKQWVKPEVDDFSAAKHIQVDLDEVVRRNATDMIDIQENPIEETFARLTSADIHRLGGDIESKITERAKEWEVEWDSSVKSRFYRQLFVIVLPFLLGTLAIVTGLILLIYFSATEF